MAISAGVSHTCAVRANGQVWCWGGNADKQLGDGSTAATRTSPVLVTVPGVSNAIDVAAYATHTCAYGAFGQVWCWGNDQYGKLGDGLNTSSSATVTAITFAGGIAVGLDYSCARQAEGNVRCWGHNAGGQLGTGNTNDVSPPGSVVVGLSDVVDIAAGKNVACALLATGKLKCWGAGATTPVDAGGGFAPDPPPSITVGAAHACTLRSDGTVDCWGYNGDYELGRGTSFTFSTAFDKTQMRKAVSVATNSWHSCAVRSDGNVVCWGTSNWGGLGNGQFSSSAVPYLVVGGLDHVREVSTGIDHTCALRADGSIYCWGRNTEGQLGIPTSTSSSLTPVAAQAAGTGAPYIGISAGGYHTCALAANGAVSCWGYNNNGQLGGTGGLVAGISGASSIASGGGFTCALVQGTVSCWGDNSSGQLGQTRPSGSTPQTIPGLSAVSKIVAGLGHACAIVMEPMPIRTTVRCWGYNNAGQLGNGSQSNSSTPVAVTGLTGAIALGAGFYTTCALTADDQAKCWGDNQWGEIGNGTTSTTPQFTPAVVTGFTRACVSEGAACTTNASCCGGDCAGGKCQPPRQCGFNYGSGEPCYDANPCTLADACDGAGHCIGTPAPAGMSCDADNNVCTGVDACDGAGTCRAGAPLVTDDGNICTTDSCDPATGVSNTPIAGCGVPPSIPPANPTVLTSVGDNAKFLFTGTNPVQTGVATGTIVAAQTTVLRGRVITPAPTPVTAVTISILGHSEYGSTHPRADGFFDMAVNGGGQLTVQYQDALVLLPVQRQAETRWQDYTVLPDVTMIAPDVKSTAITPGGSSYQVASATPVLPADDPDGARTARIVFPPGTTTNGFTSPTGHYTVRATEYTVGTSGKSRMPAELPPNSAYTYAVELSIDEVDQAGLQSVTFNQPVYAYVDNFIGFPTADPQGAPMNVPSAYYDRVKAQWIPSTNGRILKVVSFSGGMANLDVTGDGVVDTGAVLTALGITDGERQQIANLYPTIGKTFWRVPVAHFSTWDWNWGFGPPSDAVPPTVPDPIAGNPVPDPCIRQGSKIECQNEILGEDIPVVGTPFSLHYQSDRVPGRHIVLDVPVSGASELPADLKGTLVTITVGGRQFNYPSTDRRANQVVRWQWDKIDAYNHAVQGEQVVSVDIGYTYSGVYNSLTKFGASGYNSSITGSRAAFEVNLWKRTKVTVDAGFDAKSRGLGGWVLSAHHTYDPNQGTFYGGDGTRRTGLAPIATRIAGGGATGFADTGPALSERFIYGLYHLATGPAGTLYIAELRRVWRLGLDGNVTRIAGDTSAPNYSGESVPATQAGIRAWGIAVGPDGSIYLGDYLNDRVRKISPLGIITTIAGDGTDGPAICSTPSFCGDGGPATSAQIQFAAGVAVGPDGSVYVSDHNHNRVRKIGTDGIISTIAGGGTGGDQGPATSASVSGPDGLAFDSDGSLYIVEGGGGRIRKVDPSGIISTVAGFAVGAGSVEDGIPATQAQLNAPQAVAADRRGTIYFTDFQTGLGFGRVRAIGPDGIVRTVGGDPNITSFVDGAPATKIGIRPYGLALAPDGTINVAENFGQYVVKITRMTPTSGTNLVVPSRDGSEAYIFDNQGRHLQTVEPIKGVARLSFGYDALGLLHTITDQDNNITTINHDANGKPTNIVAPHNQTTTFGLDVNGYLQTVTKPNTEIVTLGHQSNGLLATLRDPKQQLHTFQYTPGGHLLLDTDPAGGFTKLDKSAIDKGWQVMATTAMGRATKYTVAALASGGEQRTVTSPSGAQATYTRDSSDTHITTAADGTVTTVESNADPRFDMFSPAPNVKVQTPGGRVFYSQESRGVTPAGLEPFSSAITTETRTVKVNPPDCPQGAACPSFNSFISTYTAATNTVTSVTPENRQTTDVLDSKNRVVQHTISGLPTMAFHYDSLGRVDQITQGTRPFTINYNATTGWVDSTTDALQRTVQYTLRDNAGRLKTEILPNNHTIGFGYDPNGNLSSLTPPGRPLHGLTSNSIDLLGTYAPPPMSLSPSATQYFYNLDRQSTFVQTPTSDITFTYDNFGRLGGIGDTATVTYGYDDKDRVKSLMTSDGQGLTFDYDGSLLTSSTWSGPVAGSVTRTYNNNLRVGSRTVGGSTINYLYDNDGLLKCTSPSLLCTDAGALTLTRDPQNGRLTDTARGNVTDHWTYDAATGDAIDYAAKYGTTVLYHLQFTPDAGGRIASKTETVLTDASVTTTYSYSDLGSPDDGRLHSVTKGTQPATTYGYDANGNRTAINGVTSATYDDQDRLTSYGSTSYFYTNNGDLLRKVNGSATTNYVYDRQGNLRSVTLPDGTAITYVIDGANRRVGKKVNGTLVQGFLYDGQLRVAAELDGSNNVVSTFVYGLRPNVPEYMVRGATTYRIISDHLGSPHLVVNTGNNAVAQRMDYDEFGNVTTVQTDQATGAGSPGIQLFQPFGFAGGLYDADTKLVRFGARDYDPAVGRWTAKDPIRFAGGQANLYVYVGDDPVNVVDPGGLDPLPQLTQDVLGPFFPGFDLRQIDVRTNVSMNGPELATASGNVISFSENTYWPTTLEGMSFIAHEVTHSVQEAQSPPGLFWFTDRYSVERMRYGYKNTSYEVLATMMSDAVLVSLRNQYGVLQGDIRELSGEMMCR